MATLKELLAQKQAAANPAPAAPLKLSASAPIKIQLPKVPEIPPEEPRALGETTPGPDVPFDFASGTNSEAEKLIILARSALNTQLGIWVEAGETAAHAWLAVECQQVPGKLILLHKLPLLSAHVDNQPY